MMKSNAKATGAARSRKKRVIIAVSASLAVLLIAAALILLFARGKTPARLIAGAENKYKKTYYSYCTLPHDEGITIDGNLDEDVWRGKDWWSQTFISNTDGSMPKLRATGFTTEYGVYLASVVEDSNLVCSGQRSFSSTSMWEINFAADSVGEERTNSLYRAECNIWLDADLMALNIDVDRAVMVEGELNSGDTKSATLEMFLPWSALYVDLSKGVPSEFRAMLCYHAVLPGNDKMTAMTMVNYSRSATGDWTRFDGNGYICPDREGAVLGDSKFGYSKTGNWDISREAEGEVRSSLGYDQHFIFFKDAYGPNFKVEATFIPHHSLGTEQYPKAGFAFYSADVPLSSPYHAVSFNMAASNLADGPGGSKNVAKYSLYRLNNVESSWSESAIQESTGLVNPNAATKEGVTLTVIKYGDKFWYFADGQFVAQEVRSFMDTAVIPAVRVSGMDVTVKDYSCEALDDGQTRDYLAARGLYLIDTKNTGSHGSVTASVPSVRKGGSYTLTVTSKSRYGLSSLKINGKERAPDVRGTAVGGVYTVRDVSSHQTVEADFEKVDTVKLSGTVRGGKSAVQCDVTLTGLDDRSRRYETTSNVSKGYSLEVPPGSYRVAVTGANFTALIENITLGKDTVRDFAMKVSDFPSSVTVNGKTVRSNRGVWNMIYESQGRITASYDGGAKAKPLYFSSTASDFAVELTAKYTTEFLPGVDYQPDLMAGFFFNDGSKENWVYAASSGIISTGWKQRQGLIPYSVLRYPTKIPVTFGIAKKDNTVTVLMDGSAVATLNWNDIAPDIASGSKMAVGIAMMADKKADIEISNWRYTVGTAAAEAYAKSGVVPDGPIAEGSIFAKTVTVNGKQKRSSESKWDLSREASGVLAGSFERGSRLSPVLFGKTGTLAVMSLHAEYTTTRFLPGVEYQPDLMAGFYITDGSEEGNIVAWNDGIAIINSQWKFTSGLIDYKALRVEDRRPVTIGLVLRDGEFLVFLNDNYVTKVAVTAVLPSYKAGTPLAFGVTMVADKNADLEASEIYMDNTASAVSDYLGTRYYIGDGSLFASSLRVNGKQINSDRAHWDTSRVNEGIVCGSKAMGSKFTDLYFTTPATSSLMSMKIEYTTDFGQGGAYQRDLMAGFVLTDGTITEYVLLVNTGTLTIYKDASGALSTWNFNQYLLPEPVLLHDDAYPLKSVEMTLALRKGYVYIFADDRPVVKYRVSSLNSAFNSGTTFAAGVSMVADNDADVRFSEISYQPGSSAVDAYLAEYYGPASQPSIVSDADDLYADQLGQGYKVEMENNQPKNKGEVTLDPDTTLFIGDSYFDYQEGFYGSFYTDPTNGLPGKNAFCAGIGGTRAEQWLYLYRKVLLQYIRSGTSPRNIVVDIGSNDVYSGFPVASVTANIEKLLGELHEAFPDAKIWWFGVTVRAKNSYRAECESVNRQVGEWCGGKDWVTYLASPIEESMLGADGIHPKPEHYHLFLEALTAAGCQIADR